MKYIGAHVLHTFHAMRAGADVTWHSIMHSEKRQCSCSETHVGSLPPCSSFHGLSGAGTATVHCDTLYSSAVCRTHTHTSDVTTQSCNKTSPLMYSFVALCSQLMDCKSSTYCLSLFATKYLYLKLTQTGDVLYHLLGPDLPKNPRKFLSLA